jgi:hypothetical protein
MNKSQNEFLKIYYSASSADSAASASLWSGWALCFRKEMALGDRIGKKEKASRCEASAHPRLHSKDPNPMKRFS